MAFTSQNWSDTVISNISYQPASIDDSTPSVTTTSYCHGLTFQHSDAQFSYYTDDEMRWYAQNLEDLHAVASESSSLLDLAASSVEKISSSAAEPEAAHQLDTGSDVMSKDDKDQDLKATTLFTDEEGRPKFPVNADGKPMLPFGPEGKRNNQPVFPVSEDGMPVFPTGPNNTAIVPVDSQGKPVFPLGANMQPLHPVDSFGNMMMPVKVTDGSPAYFPSADGQRITPNDGSRKELFDNAQMWNQSLSYYNNYSYGYATYTTYYNQNATYTSTWANSGRKTKVRPEDIDMPVGPPPPPPVLQVPSVSDITSNFDSSYMTNIIKISGNMEPLLTEEKRQASKSLISRQLKQYVKMKNNALLKRANKPVEEVAQQVRVGIGKQACFAASSSESENEHPALGLDLRPKRAVIKPEHRLSPGLSVKSTDQPKKLSEERSAAASPERHSWRRAGGSEASSKRRRRRSVSTSASESNSRRRKRSRIRDVGEDDDGLVYNKRRRRSINNRRRSRKVYEESYRRRQRRHRSTTSHTPAESSETVHSNGSDHLSKRRRGRSSAATASGSLPTSDDSGREEQKRSRRKIKRNKNAADQ
ncbi:putative CAX-interacting protein 4 [Trichinella spiralis]|uniref:putative CAX-interacting protein 4 n=1 Tax=Trichinella spiralis TaxID=6334 RepID=UPI0001EFC8A2|nr:putative CAX-interacting protein 4 [Trichinella spiralis]